MLSSAAVQPDAVRPAVVCPDWPAGRTPAGHSVARAACRARGSAFRLVQEDRAGMDCLEWGCAGSFHFLRLPAAECTATATCTPRRLPCVKENAFHAHPVATQWRPSPLAQGRSSGRRGVEFHHPHGPFRRNMPGPVAPPAKPGMARLSSAAFHMAGCDMSADFLFSLQKLLSWLFAFLTALLPQHLIAQLSEADRPIAAYTTAAEAPRPPPAAYATSEPPTAGTPAAAGSADSKAKTAR